jgi:diaminopropionate ammonia-lyase
MDYYINKAKDFIPDSLTTKILANSHPLNYHQQLSNYQPTPLLALRQLAKKYGIGNIYVKDESHRFGLQAFKGLGAAYAIHIINKE